MNGTLSSYLNLFKVRGQTWCFTKIHKNHGFSLPANNALLFYMVITGSVQISGIGGKTIELHPGNVASILSGESHTVRANTSGEASRLDFLCDEQTIDAPPTIAIGEGPIAAHLLCAKLRVEWPTGLHRSLIPSVMYLRPAVIGLENMPLIGAGPGSTAILTRFAELLLVTTLRNHLQCSTLFRTSHQPDPISHAMQIIELDPGADWSVTKLARKVGMGRSTFASCFKASIGRTPMEVITDFRMQQAAALLHRNLKNTEISERVGYRSEAAFSRRFKQHFGMSPTDMKRDANI